MAEKVDLVDALKTLGETLNWPARAVPQVVAVFDAFIDHAEERAGSDEACLEFDSGRKTIFEPEAEIAGEPDGPEALSEPKVDLSCVRGIAPLAEPTEG